MANYKKLCTRCKKNYMHVSWKNNYPVCYDCQKVELDQEVKDPKLKRMFKIPEEFYKQNAFLRSIKINYHRFGELSGRQVDTFKEAVKKMKADAKAEAKEKSE